MSYRDILLTYGPPMRRPYDDDGFPTNRREQKTCRQCGATFLSGGSDLCDYCVEKQKQYQQNLNQYIRTMIQYLKTLNWTDQQIKLALYEGWKRF